MICFEAFKFDSKVKKPAKHNLLGLLNAHKLIFAIELSTEERMSNFLAAGFLFSVTDKCFSPAFLFRGQVVGADCTEEGADEGNV